MGGVDSARRLARKLQEPHGEEEELLKDNPPSGRLQGVHGGRVVDHLVGLSRPHQPLAFQNGSGQHLRQSGKAGRKRQADGAAQNLRGNPGGQAVDGHYAPGDAPLPLHRLKERILHLGTAVVSPEGAVKTVFPAILQRFSGVGLVKIDQVEGAGAVGHGKLGEVQALADIAGAGRADDHGLKAGGLVHLQLTDGHQAGAVFIGTGEIGDEVVDRFDVQPLERRGAGAANAGKRRHRRCEIHPIPSFSLYYIRPRRPPASPRGAACNWRRWMVS